MHISAGSIPASPVAGCFCTISASTTTTGSCALFIARKLMQICQGMATQGRSPGQPTRPPHLATVLQAQQQQQPPLSLPPLQLLFSCSCGRTK